MISTGLLYLQFSMNSQGFSPARLTWPAYDDGTRLGNVKIALPENIALLLHPHVDVPWSLVVTFGHMGAVGIPIQTRGSDS